MGGLRDAYVLGVGMTKFLRPRKEREYPELGYEAGVKAMIDAGINYDDVEMGIACFGYGGSTAGQRVFYQFGMTGIPIYNARNACATGSTGLNMARNAVRSGTADCVLVIGFEQMAAGPLANDDPRPSAVELSTALMHKTRGKFKSPMTAQFFANAGLEYMERYGARAEDFAELARLSHENSTKNPYAQFQTEYTLQEILDSPMIHSPLTKLQCSPTSDGAAAAVIVSGKYLTGLRQRNQAILMAGQSLMSDDPSLFSGSSMDLVGFGMTKKAAKAALAEAGVTAKDVGVCEVHDCFSTNELILLDGLGLCAPGEAHKMVREGSVARGGQGPLLNPSGGLISKGHPLGATGVAQCAELTWHLRGWANNRLGRSTTVALQHNLGLGGCCVVTVYRRADGKASQPVSNEEVVKTSAFQYNPAVEARYVTPTEGDIARSRKHRVEFAVGDTLEKIAARL
ncbi:Non-specific lipid-transfer protein [Cercospora beticola]|uniref:propanoyl-CoA C-acyltransferase n=1 Tax=Cercospora beticola TaxID=122368 RepID=A0A2G5I8D5_CERBT|nr:Non-specific lipid-transfer protein [Cercospora beticola]PIB01071.1 Non-specific lipid-transfer protein [Cercospora beticola]WPA96923.1 hypothetical protein RHO25_001531 [Cercospora beticola]CAK1354696.1 unnamed protein product [Cercospora beticola]